jgi:replicative DNA helicase
MSVSLPVKLLNTVLYGGTTAYRALARSGFRSVWIQDPELQNVWDFISMHFSDHGILPSHSVVKSRIPSFHVIPIEAIRSENAVSISEVLFNEYLYDQIYTVINKTERLNNADPMKAREYAMDALSKLHAGNSDVEFEDLSDCAEDAIREYEETSEGLNKGLSYPWPSLQRETMGMHPEELILVYGRPKSMKTFIALHIAVHAYVHSNARVLIISRELSVKQMRKRIIALLANIHYGPWRKASLSEEEKARVFNMLLSLGDNEKSGKSMWHENKHPSIRIASGHSRKYKGLELVRVLADEFEPDLVLDDGIYLAAGSMNNTKDPMDWRTLVDITQSAKRMAAEFKIPYLATTQAKRGNTPKKKKGEDLSASEILEDMNTFSYSDSFAQDCSLAIRAVKIPRDISNGNPQHLFLGLPAYREGSLSSFAVHGQPCVNFNEFNAEDYRKFRIDKKVAAEALRRDNELGDVPAGPTTSCDSFETQIPANIQSVKDFHIPKKNPRRRR